MTDNTKAYKPRQRKSKGPFSDDLLDQLLAQVRGHDAESLLGESGLVGQLKKQLAERMLSAELNHHLATERASGDEPGNYRNGSSAKTVLTPCHLSAYRSHGVFGIKEPADFRRNGASAFSAYWSQSIFGIKEPV